MTNETFTIEDAIQIQTDQINDWCKVLKERYEAPLRLWAALNNVNAKSTQDIVRGVDIDNYIHNTFINN